ncbi:solute carrier family 2, facilitated glucose transporter member 10 [Platysternon megacephalum]|uniref:Solute carrier family 2, facilitated glucose transporter member 10 n=1 Tax=Platysternon megacephalum TaxID=55544 RepID=A0A4D9EDX3_9SAUR|nr:solute carrier family 2, facilitated glucose transporter member 10 [Platysternon megacephalum]
MNLSVVGWSGVGCLVGKTEGLGENGWGGWKNESKESGSLHFQKPGFGPQREEEEQEVGPQRGVVLKGKRRRSRGGATERQRLMTSPSSPVGSSLTYIKDQVLLCEPQ